MSAMFGIEPEFEDGPRSARRLRRLKRRLRQHPDGELNIVSMIDVFAVLVFFLLVGSSISASKLYALKLDLPSVTSSAAVNDEAALNLAINLFEDYLEITSNEGLSQRLPKLDSGFDTAGLNQALVDIKKAHPKENRLTLFVAENIAYADIIAVMDSSREYPAGVVGEYGSAALFPLISMGDAPISKTSVESGEQP